MMRRVGAMAGLVGAALGTMACSSTPTDTPQAAMSILLGGLNNCGVTSNIANVGDPRPLNEGGTRVVAGEPTSEGGTIIAKVNCSVIESEDGTFDVFGSLTAGPALSVTLLEPLSKGGEARASMTSFTPPATNLQSPSDTPCVISTNPSFGRGGKFDVIPGAIFAGFRCDAYVDPRTPDRTCTADGTFIFENCATK